MTTDPSRIGYAGCMCFFRCLLSVMVLLLVVGCGRTEMGLPDPVVTSGAPAGTGGAAGTGGIKSSTGGSAAGTGGAASGRWGTVFDGATDGRTPAECSAFADAIASEFEPGGSVVIIRFDYQTQRPLGYAQWSYYGVCSANTEAQARACTKVDSPLSLPFLH